MQHCVLQIILRDKRAMFISSLSRSKLSSFYLLIFTLLLCYICVSLPSQYPSKVNILRANLRSEYCSLPWILETVAVGIWIKRNLFRCVIRSLCRADFFFRRAGGCTQAMKHGEAKVTWKILAIVTNICRRVFQLTFDSDHIFHVSHCFHVHPRFGMQIGTELQRQSRVVE